MKRNRRKLALDTITIRSLSTVDLAPVAGATVGFGGACNPPPPPTGFGGATCVPPQATVGFGGGCRYD